MNFKFESVNTGSQKPLYMQVAENIENKITSNEIPVGGKLPDQETLAKMFNVSLFTITEALTGLVKEGYISRRPNHGTVVISAKPSKTLDLKSKNEICLLICTGPIKSTVGVPGFNLFINSVEEKLKESGLKLFYQTITGSEKAVFSGAAKNIAGLVVAGNLTPKHMRLVRKTKLPFVLVGEIIQQEKTEENSDLVTSDDSQTYYLAAKYLADSGHKRIAYLANYLDKYPWDAAGLDGYRQALKEAGIEHDRNLLIEAGFGMENGCRAVLEFLEREIPFTGIVCTNGANMYYGAMKAFNQKNIRVPGDVSVVGVDIAGATSVVQDNSLKGALAVERLIKRLTNPQWKPERVIVPSRLEVNELSSRRVA
ncbi:MAG: hypothetical protein A2297_00025 [Elusimicrobia bacterium RIFOXYB2_FULL_48_7]|nr:MAG: hypothetical protein A2297_00025 [Elusimicrobia bacterium RIFOXYB2_FULL_48_7]